MNSFAMLVKGPIGTRVTSPGCSFIFSSKKSTADPLPALVVGGGRLVFP